MDVGSADATVRSEFLARHVYQLLRRALEGIPEEDGTQSANQIALANRLVEVLFEHGAMADDRVADAARLLLEAVERRVLGDTPAPVPRPTLSLRRTGLLVNGRRDVQIASEIAREIPSADRIDLLCAFVRHSGLRLFRSELEERVREGVQVRASDGPAGDGDAGNLAAHRGRRPVSRTRRSSRRASAVGAARILRDQRARRGVAPRVAEGARIIRASTSAE